MFEPIEPHEPKKAGRPFLYGDTGCSVLPLSLDKRVIAWIKSKELGARSRFVSNILKKAMDEENAKT